MELSKYLNFEIPAFKKPQVMLISRSTS